MTRALLHHPKAIVVVLRVLVFCGLVMLGLGPRPANETTFWFTVGVYGVTNFGYLFARPDEFTRPRTQLWLFLFDVVVVSLLIVLRGSQVPQFIMAYFTLVLMAAVVQGLGSAFVNAVFVCTVYAAVTAWGMDVETLFTFPVLSQFAFFFVVSVFMGQVAEWARLEARERARAEGAASVLGAKVAEKTADLRRSLEDLSAARDRLAASDRLATLGMLSAGIGHEIRNPLAAVRAALEETPLLLDEVEAAAGDAPGVLEPLDLLRAATRDCDEACSHLQRIAEDLTTLARSAPTDPVAVPAAEALEATARLLHHRERGGIRFEVRSDTRRRALADPGRLQQVLLNLAGNALDAMDGTAGTLTLAAEDARGGGVAFRVEDTGCGMTPEVRARVFQAFFTTKRAGKGTGLGLHLVREIVQAHGGTIEFDSRQGEGTTFRVEWPAAPDTAETTEGAEGDDHGRRQDPVARRGRRGDDPQGAPADVAARAL